MNTFGFTLIKEEKIQEISGIAKFYHHDKTGAQFLSIINDDANKCFAVSFRTPPKDSTGVAHILEHSVLCGSEKYPTKEPFVQLLKSSLQTFLNALTYPDKTCYPVASTNTQDLYNLMDVYMDAVFFPRVRTSEGPHIFAQEGWHIDTSGEKWQFKGVVYNEMKGSYSSPDTILNEQLKQGLFPDTLYKHSSGGDPKHILDLNYEDFEEFHKNYYHPSNAYFFAWGDDDEQMRLKKIDEVISRFDKIDIDSAIPLQKTINSFRTLDAKFEVSQNDVANKGHALLAWLLPPVYESEINLLFGILDNILMGFAGAPLRKALIDSGLGEDVRGGLGNSLIQMYYSVGLRSIELEKKEEMQDIIIKTLTKLANDDIDKKTIEAAINSYEFSLRENSFHMFPKGLMTMTKCLTNWLHDKDPIEALKWEENLATIKEKVKNNENIFENLIKKYFLENQHSVLIKLVPDKEQGQLRILEEEAKIEKLYNSLSESQRKEIERKSRNIKEAQEKEDSQEALETIPVLSLDDISKIEKELPLQKDKNNIGVYTHPIETNGIIYSKFICKLDSLPYDLLQLLPLYSRALTEIGTAKSNYTELGLEIGAHTGGIKASTNFLPKLQSDQDITCFVLSGKSTKDNIEKLATLFEEILFSTNFDNKKRFTQMLLEEKANVEKMLIPGGRTFAMTRLNARFSSVGALQEHTQGVSYVNYIRELVDTIDSNWNKILKDLQTIHAHLFSKNNLIFDITANNTLLEYSQKAFTKLLAQLNESKISFKTATWEHNFIHENEAYILPSRVNYMGMGLNLYKEGYTFHGSALIINRYLRMTYLWDRVRVIGGAYGCGIQFSKADGTLIFASYRDPQTEKTIEVFQKSVDFLENINLSERELNCAIIGTIGEYDSYLLPEAKASTALWRDLSNETIEFRQKVRDEIFNTKTSDFHAYAQILKKAINHANYVSFGGENLENFAQNKNWKIVKIL